MKKDVNHLQEINQVNVLHMEEVSDVMKKNVKQKQEENLVNV